MSSPTLRIKPRYFILTILFNMLVLSSAAFAHCENLSGKDASYCHSIRLAQSGKSCDLLKRDRLGHTFCVVLSNWTQGENCNRESPRWTSETTAQCRALTQGLANDPISDLSSETALEYYEFGRFIRGNHRIMFDIRQKNLLFKRISAATQGQNQSISEKVLDIATNVTEAIENSQNTSIEGSLVAASARKGTQEHTTISIEEIAEYALNLVKFVEKHKTKMILESNSQLAPLQIQMGSRFFSTLATSPKKGGFKNRFYNEINAQYRKPLFAPSDIYVFHNGHIAIDISEMVIGSKHFKLAPISEDPVKTVTFSLDYETCHILRKVEHPFNRNSSNIDNYDEMFDNEFRRILSEIQIRRKWEISPGDDVWAGPQVQILGKTNRKIIYLERYSRYNLKEFSEIILKDPSYETIEGHSKEVIKLSIMVQLLAQLKKIHSAKTHHRDVRPENILVEFNEIGLPQARFSNAEHAMDLWSSDPKIRQKQENSCVITPYTSPEYARNSLDDQCARANFGLKNDVWSLGLVFAELWYEQEISFPKDLQSLAFVDNHALVTAFYNIPKSKWQAPDDSVQGLIKKMLYPTVGKGERPTAAEALRLADHLLSNALDEE